LRAEASKKKGKSHGRQNNQHEKSGKKGIKKERRVAKKMKSTFAGDSHCAVEKDRRVTVACSDAVLTGRKKTP
jgi:hypothetical protein